MQTNSVEVLQVKYKNTTKMAENNQSSQPSPKTYLNEESHAIKNFSVSQQGGDAVESSSSNSCLPIGLRLNKSPSLLNLLKNNASKWKSRIEANEKPKPRNFPATSIKIGDWQRSSRHEGDITAKIYFARRQLMWEVLEGSVKYKIEIQWSDITAIRGIMPQNQTGTLEVELSQPPSYFEENTSTLRNQTRWGQAPDFTGGQAPVCRRHSLSFKPGILDKHYENLLQCDQRLYEMSLKPFPSHQSPYFDPAFGISEMSLPPPTMRIVSAIENPFIGDQSGVPSSHHNLVSENVEPSMGEPTDVINPSYNYETYSSAGHRYINPYYYPDYNPTNND